MTKKMTFGEWTAANISGNAGNAGHPNRVVRVDAGFFSVEGLERAAKSMDQAVFMAQLEGRKLNPLESFAMEVLFAMAGWNDNQEAMKSYQDYQKSER